MKKLLIIILIWMGVFVLLRPVGDFKAEAVGNIVYRRNLVTGIITADNGDKSYAVEIGESGKSIKKIFTLSPDPDLAVGDKARVLYRDGNKEDMILLAPTKPAITIVWRYALIVTGPNEIQLFDMSGNLITQIVGKAWSYMGCALTMDSLGNIYLNDWGEWIRKYDSEGNLLISHEIGTGGLEDGDWMQDVKIGSDGYLYSFEMLEDRYGVKKRNITDLTIVEAIVLIEDDYYSYDGGVAIDPSGNFYAYRNPYIVKHNSAGTKLGQIEVGGLSNEWGGIVVCGNNVYIPKTSSKLCYVPLDLSTYTIWDMPSAICYGIDVADGHLILSGWDGDGDGATSKYDSDRNLISTVKLTAADYAYKAGGYNF